MGGKARWPGGYVSAPDIQANDLRELGAALADYIARTAGRP